MTIDINQQPITTRNNFLAKILCVKFRAADTKQGILIYEAKICPWISG